eukprot:6066305-Pyramimonas_sp.AAC.1
MRTLPLAPSVELPTGPRSSWGVRRNGPRPPCEPCRWSLRWGSLWGAILVMGVPKWPEGRLW